MTAQTPATVADILGELVDALEAAVLRLRDREDMRAILPGDINQTLALELGVMVSEVEQIARPAIDNAQTFIAFPPMQEGASFNLEIIGATNEKDLIHPRGICPHFLCKRKRAGWSRIRPHPGKDCQLQKLDLE